MHGRYRSDGFAIEMCALRGYYAPAKSTESLLHHGTLLLVLTSSDFAFARLKI